MICNKFFNMYLKILKEKYSAQWCNFWTKVKWPNVYMCVPRGPSVCSYVPTRCTSVHAYTACSSFSRERVEGRRATPSAVSTKDARSLSLTCLFKEVAVASLARCPKVAQTQWRHNTPWDFTGRKQILSFGFGNGGSKISEISLFLCIFRRLFGKRQWKPEIPSNYWNRFEIRRKCRSPLATPPREMLNLHGMH